jgi:hypothetical protein
MTPLLGPSPTVPKPLSALRLCAMPFNGITKELPMMARYNIVTKEASRIL